MNGSKIAWNMNVFLLRSRCHCAEAIDFCATPRLSPNPSNTVSEPFGGRYFDGNFKIHWNPFERNGMSRKSHRMMFDNWHGMAYICCCFPNRFSFAASIGVFVSWPSYQLFAHSPQIIIEHRCAFTHSRSEERSNRTMARWMDAFNFTRLFHRTRR